MFIKEHANFYFAEQKCKPLIYLTVSQNCRVVAIQASAMKKKCLASLISAITKTYLGYLYTMTVDFGTRGCRIGQGLKCTITTADGRHC